MERHTARLVGYINIKKTEAECCLACCFKELNVSENDFIQLTEKESAKLYLTDKKYSVLLEKLMMVSQKPNPEVESKLQRLWKKHQKIIPLMHTRYYQKNGLLIGGSVQQIEIQPTILQRGVVLELFYRESQQPIYAALIEQIRNECLTVIKSANQYLNIDQSYQHASKCMEICTKNNSYTITRPGMDQFSKNFGDEMTSYSVDLFSYLSFVFRITTNLSVIIIDNLDPRKTVSDWVKILTNYHDLDEYLIVIGIRYEDFVLPKALNRDELVSFVNRNSSENLVQRTHCLHLDDAVESVIPPIYTINKYRA